MYGYEERSDITIAQVLQRVTELQIFEFVFEHELRADGKYTSVFREDNSPKCYFSQADDGKLMFVDFGDPFKTHRDCFNAVMEKYNVSLRMAIDIIASKFGLSKVAVDYQSVSYNKATNEGRQKQHIDTVITYTKRDYDKKDVLFWSQFFITKEQLKEDNIFAISKFSMKSRKGTLSITKFNYCYAFDFIDAVTIYQPYSIEHRFTKSCNENHIGNIDNLPDSGEELIIQKSYKDHRVIRNTITGSNVIWFQNEGCTPDMDILVNLTERFKLITIFFDNDKTGHVAATKLMAIFNTIRSGCCRSVTMPKYNKHKKLYGHYLKDPALFISKEGRQELLQNLNKIGLYGKDT